MPSTQSRRMLLLAAGTVFSAPLSGCSTVSELPRDSKSVSIANVWVKNLGDSHVVFDVLIQDVRDDEVVFWETYKAHPMTDRDDDGNAEIDMHSWESPVQSPGNYALHARAEADEQTGEGEIKSVHLQTGADCLSIVVEIGLMGELSVDVNTDDAC